MKKYILLLFLSITITVSAQVLTVPAIKKEQTEWCWAASSACVLAYYGYWERQCDIAEYVRLNGSSHGSTNCCANALQGCNKGASFNDIANILMKFGNIKSAQADIPLIIDAIQFHLNKRCPIIIRLEDPYDPMHGHAMVIYGIDDQWGGTFIHFMDPDTGVYNYDTYNNLLNYKELQWSHTLTPLTCPPSKDYPCHCYNWIQDGDETGVDCGGNDCPPCGGDPPPPPTGNCSDCIKNRDEKEIDCGGYFCPPCQDLPEEKVIENKIFANNNIIYGEVMATKKITAKGNTRVVSGAKARFITEDGGSIVLLPGFKAENGSNFSTQMKDLSAYSRICPDSICLTASFAAEISKYGYIYFSIEDLLYAVKIELEAYDEQELIYSDIKKVTHNGNFYYGIPITNQDTYTYLLDCIVYYCNGDRHRCKFWLSSSYGHHKSLNERFEKTDTLLHFSPSHIETTVSSTATSAPQFSILPNPNSGTFQLETNFPLSEIGTLKITNPLGITVYKTQNVMEYTIRLPNSASGMFFVVMMLKDGTVLTQKMMVQR